MFGSTQSMLCGATPDHFIGNRVCLGLKLLNNLVMSSPFRERRFTMLILRTLQTTQRQPRSKNTKLVEKCALRGSLLLGIVTN